mgnify:FL=1
MSTKKDYRHISMFIHGWWGAGKSWLSASAPAPRLVLDTEGGYHDTAGKHILWNPQEPLPQELDKETSVIVDVNEWSVVESVMNILRSGDHPFETIIIDSVHELQDQLKRVIANPDGQYDPNAVFQHQAWGRLKNNMGLLFRELRDFTRPTSAKRVNVVLVCGSDDELIPHKPLLEGGSRKVVTGFYDIVGYLRTARDEKQQEVRVLQITPNSSAVAKCRLHNLQVAYGSEIVNPDIKKMIAVVNKPQEATDEKT